MKNCQLEDQIENGRPIPAHPSSWKRALALVCFLGLVLTAQAGQASLGGHQSSAAANVAREVRVATVKGFNLAFMLLDQSSEAQAPDGELLLFIGGPDGKPVRDAAVQYTVVGPDGEKRTAPAQAARGGYRTLVDWQAPGTYLVQAEVVTGNGSLTDQFVCRID